MSVKPIRQLGDPVLRQVSRPVELFDTAELRQLIVNLRDTLHAFQARYGAGRGIAAPQIGVPLRAIYLEFAGKSYTMINPHFTSKSEKMFTVWDSCFSYFGVAFEVSRHQTVTLDYYDALGNKHELEASDAFSELLQHEVEHLDGILAIDQLVPVGKIMEQSEFIKRSK